MLYLIALEGKLQVIEPLPEPPRGAIGTELGEGILRGRQYDDAINVVRNTLFLEEKSWEDTLLFIEDVGEAPYKLDRMLQTISPQWFVESYKRTGHRYLYRLLKVTKMNGIMI